MSSWRSVCTTDDRGTNSVFNCRKRCHFRRPCFLVHWSIGTSVINDEVSSHDETRRPRTPKGESKVVVTTQSRRYLHPPSTTDYRGRDRTERPLSHSTKYFLIRFLGSERVTLPSIRFHSFATRPLPGTTPGTATTCRTVYSLLSVWRDKCGWRKSIWRPGSLV